MNPEKYKVKNNLRPDLARTCDNLECKAISILRFQNNEKDKKWKAKKKRWKNDTKNITDWKNDLQDVFNWIIREIDKDRLCISHPHILDFLRYDCGHYYTVKSHQSIRFNAHNCHKQSSIANELYGGCPEYTNGINDRYGSEYLEMMLGLPLEWKGTAKDKFTIPNIRDIYLPNARKIKRDMKKGIKFDRYEVNEIIGIYVK